MLDMNNIIHVISLILVVTLSGGSILLACVGMADSDLVEYYLDKCKAKWDTMKDRYNKLMG